MSDRRRAALVTGASSGFGAAIARALSEAGWAVALGARRVDRLEELAASLRSGAGEPFFHALDVSEPGSIGEFLDAATSALGPADALVSNAGICAPGALHEMEEASLESELETNLLGPLRLARRVLPSMLEQKRGDLVFISSQNAVAPRPLQVGYTASKAGLEGAVGALRMELEGSGVRASIVRPGPALTEMGQDWEPGRIRRLLSTWRHWGLLRHEGYLKAEHVARAVVAVLSTPRGAQLDLVQINPEAPLS